MGGGGYYVEEGKGIGLCAWIVVLTKWYSGTDGQFANLRFEFPSLSVLSPTHQPAREVLTCATA